MRTPIRRYIPAPRNYTDTEIQDGKPNAEACHDIARDLGARRCVTGPCPGYAASARWITLGTQGGPIPRLRPARSRPTSSSRPTGPTSSMRATEEWSNNSPKSMFRCSRSGPSCSATCTSITRPACSASSACAGRRALPRR